MHKEIHTAGATENKSSTLESYYTNSYRACPSETFGPNSATPDVRPIPVSTHLQVGERITCS